VSDPRLRALAEAALEVSAERRAVLDRMRRALVMGDEAAALRCARILTGLEEDDAERDSAGARLDRSAGH